jgi:hypothetical protein
VRYRIADLDIESEFSLSELPLGTSGAEECRVQSGPELPADGVEARWDHHWSSPDGTVVLSCARDGDAYRLGMPGLVTFLIEGDGSSITCCAHETLPPGTLEHLLIDQVLPRVLTHRGRVVIHAGCVATPEGAVLFLGDSGAGKSTLCGEFARAGFPLLGDDGVLVRRNATSGFEALATYPGLRLLPDPLLHLFDENTARSPVAHYTEKRRLDRDASGFTLAVGPEPLRALYVLEAGSTIEIAPVPARHAFMALVRSSFQLHLDDETRSRGHFERIAALLDAIPVRRLSYPRDFACLGAVREAILEDVSVVPVSA